MNTGLALDPLTFQEADFRERVKYSLLFLICRVVHLVFYVIAICVMGWNLRTLYCALSGTVLYASVALPAWRYKGRREYLLALAQAAVLVIDAGMIALTRSDVQAAVFDSNTDLFTTKGPAGACVETTTQIFQFIIFYHVMFVLGDRYPAVIGALCVSMYSAVVLGSHAHSAFFDFNGQQDLVCLLFTWFVSVIAKRKMLRSKGMVMELLDMQKENLVREKVLRCKAEFTCEQLVSQQPAPQVKAQISANGSVAVPSEVAVSAHTAPPLLQIVQEKGELLCSETSEGDGDCLPATALASVENCPAPRALASLIPGERVLCYDNIGRGLAYATIKECHPIKHSTKSDWIHMTLADGTQLQMTADHPVVVESRPLKSQHAQLELRRQCVRADLINAEQDCLMVLRMVSTPVAQIEKIIADQAADVGMPEQQWITVTVDQPDRHELFVASPNKAGVAGQSVAVGSSDRRPSSILRDYTVKNSFIDFGGEQARVLKRSNSVPSDFKFDRHIIELPPASCDKVSSDKVSSSTEPSADVPDFEVTIGRKPARLSDFIHAQSAGTSQGSMHVDANHCTPCSFHFSWLHNPSKRSCKLSHMCEYCHDSSHHWGRHAVSWSRFRKHRKPESQKNHGVIWQ